MEEIAEALQDPGKQVTVKEKGTEQTRHKFPLMEKLAAKIFTNIQREFNKPDGLTKNVSRGKMPLLKEILMGCCHTDISETDPFFHRFGTEGKVYLLMNNPVHSGLDIAIKQFQKYIENLVQQKNSARTMNNGLRLACILLDSKFRGSVAGIMTKKKNCQMSDVSGDPVTSFFKQILTECFSNPDYVVPKPSS
jgi:hypothetical protein